MNSVVLSSVRFFCGKDRNDRMRSNYSIALVLLRNFSQGTLEVLKNLLLDRRWTGVATRLLVALFFAGTVIKSAPLKRGVVATFAQSGEIVSMTPKYDEHYVFC